MVASDCGTLEYQGVGEELSADKMGHQQRLEEEAFLLMGERQEVEDHLVMAVLECPVEQINNMCVRVCVCV